MNPTLTSTAGQRLLTKPNYTIVIVSVENGVSHFWFQCMNFYFLVRKLVDASHFSDAKFNLLFDSYVFKAKQTNNLVILYKHI